MYFNTSALNRPFDDLSSERVRAEAEAVAALFAAIEDGRIELATSDYVEFEATQNPDRDRARRVVALLRDRPIECPQLEGVLTGTQYDDRVFADPVRLKLEAFPLAAHVDPGARARFDALEHADQGPFP